MAEVDRSLRTSPYMVHVMEEADLYELRKVVVLGTLLTIIVSVVIFAVLLGAVGTIPPTVAISLAPDWAFTILSLIMLAKKEIKHYNKSVKLKADEK